MGKQDKEYYKKYYEENKNKIAENKKLYYQEKKDGILKKQKKYYEENPESLKEKSKESYYKNIENNRERRRKYYHDNKENLLKQQKENYLVDGAEKIRNRRKTDVLYRLRGSLGNRLRDFLKQNGYRKNQKIFQTIGCTPEELRQHLEEMFKNGMNWENYGEWHIDHIIPLSSAKSEEEIYKLNHYTNLQPLWKEENLSKGNKILD
jgi:hypothetical protein